jgi:5'-3' exonuclease
MPSFEPGLQLHLLDGTYDLFRSFYGSPKQNFQGQEVGATITFLKSLLRFLRLSRITHVACAFDRTIHSFRNELFKDYKTGEEIDPLIKQQFLLAEKAAMAVGMVVWPMIDFEADDALASAATKWENDPRISRILICTPDKDLAQCINETVVCFDRRKEQTLDLYGVIQKFGVTPNSIPDWLGLVGDVPDGIPGIRGWGKKSSSLILSRYIHLENIPRKSSNWNVSIRGSERLNKSLWTSWEDALLYRHLATLRRDVPLAEDLDALEWKGVCRGKFLDLCRELGVSNLENSVIRWRG